MLQLVSLLVSDLYLNLTYQITYLKNVEQSCFISGVLNIYFNSKRGFRETKTTVNSVNSEGFGPSSKVNFVFLGNHP